MQELDVGFFAQSSTQVASSQGAGLPSGHVGYSQHGSLSVGSTHPYVPSWMPGGHGIVQSGGSGRPSSGQKSTHVSGFDGGADPS